VRRLGLDRPGVDHLREAGQLCCRQPDWPRGASGTDARGRAPRSLVGCAGGSLGQLKREREGDLDLVVADTERDEVETTRQLSATELLALNSGRQLHPRRRRLLRRRRRTVALEVLDDV
jgi:hypothetical protein